MWGGAGTTANEVCKPYKRLVNGKAKGVRGRVRVQGQGGLGAKGGPG